MTYPRSHKGEKGGALPSARAATPSGLSRASASSCQHSIPNAMQWQNTCVPCQCGSANVATGDTTRPLDGLVRVHSLLVPCFEIDA